MRTFLLMILVLSLTSSFVAQSRQSIITSPSKFRLLDANVSFKGGEKCAYRNDEEDFPERKEIRFGSVLYYDSRFRPGPDEGLVIDDLATKKCRLIPLSAIAESAGWFRGPREDSIPDGPNKIYRVGDKIWMGTNGVGVLVFDVRRERWSRFDLKPLGIPGDHAQIAYADDEFVFVLRGEFPGALLHFYSMKKNKWLMLKAVSTSQISEYGHSSGPAVQVYVDHKTRVKYGYLPVDWTFMGLKAAPTSARTAYRFEVDFSKSKTIFEIPKSVLRKAFT